MATRSSSNTSIDRRRFLLRSAALGLVSTFGCGGSKRPNIVFIHTDDQRHDAMGCAGNNNIETPNIDALAGRGVRFKNAFVTTSICSPSRACCFTGRYGSLNGVMAVPGGPLNDGEVTFVDLLKRQGYQAGYAGKWHLNGPATPREAGYDVASYFHSNGPQWGRKVIEQDAEVVAEGFIEDYIADRAINFVRSAAGKDQPFLLHYSTQVPHMDHEFRWRPKPETIKRYSNVIPDVPQSWGDDLGGKPEYLKKSRSRDQADSYGYQDPSRVQAHIRDYYAAITDMDAALGRMLGTLDELSVRDNTYVILMGDNGWLLGEHRFTSKVLPYEESIRVPLLVAGPGIAPSVREELVLNADVMPTILEFTNLTAPRPVNGRSLTPLLSGGAANWRDSFYYESLSGSLGTHPLVAVRNHRWKYVQTMHPERPTEVAFEELYDLADDPIEMNNLASRPEHASTHAELAAELSSLRRSVAAEQAV